MVVRSAQKISTGNKECDFDAGNRSLKTASKNQI
jgi:hypothetical protein